MAAVPQVHVDPQIIRLPVVDGKGVRFMHVTTADGLSQTRVAQIVQDDQGFMWFGTQYGLNRYDGSKVRVFVHDPQRRDSLGCAFITALFKDRSGTLWVGCDQVLDRFDPVTETFAHYQVEPANSEGLDAILHISQDRTGMLWLATGTGLHRFDPATGQTNHFRHNPANASSLSTNDIRWTGEDKSGTFWVGTSRGLDAFDRDAGKVILHIPLLDGVRCSFYEDRFGVFWILYASGSGPAVLNRKTNVLTRYSFYEREPPDGAVTGVMDMLEDREGNLWIGSPGLGVLRFERERHRFIRYRNVPGDVESLAEDKVTGLYEDHEGNVWAGLHSKGIDHFAPKPTLIETFRREPGNSNSLAMDFVNAIYEDHERTRWIGNDDGLTRIDRDTGRYTSFPAGLGVKPMVITIIEDPSGVLWVGTFGNGLNRVDRRTRRFTTYLHNPADPSSLSNDEVHRLFVDHAGTLWVATDDGLDRFDPATGSFTVYKVDWQSRRSQSYVSVAEDKQGMLWLGTHYSGLHRFDPATGHFTVYKSKPNSPGTLSDNMVPCVHIDSSDVLWVATQNGLNRFDPHTATFTAYDQRNGLQGNAVACILHDSRGALWMSTNKGISKFDPSSNAFKNYSTFDTLHGTDLTGWSSCVKSRTGEMFFGGFSGGLAFFPEMVEDSSYAPPVVLTEFRLSGIPVNVGVKSPLTKSISATTRLTLFQNQTTFSLAFSALSYLNPANNRYRYKLEGLDQAWHEVGSDERLASYTTLPAGTYAFHLQAATGHGLWGEPGVTLDIDILPPIWKTGWFRTGCGALVVILMWVAYRARLKQIAKQFNIRLEERVAERTRIARELHDTLMQSLQGVLLNFHAVTYLLPSRPAEARQTLENVIERARQAITEGRNAVEGLRSSMVVTPDLAEAITRLSEELAADQSDESSPEFCVNVEGRPRNLAPILGDEVYRIAAEAVRNAFRHAQARQIEVEIRYDQRQFRLRVRDNGKGIDPTVLRDGGCDGHYGLAGLYERARLVAGKLVLWSELDAGTEAELTIPASVAYAKSSTPRRSVFVGVRDFRRL